MGERKINIIILTEAKKEINVTTSLELNKEQALRLAKIEHDYSGWVPYIEEEGKPATVEGIRKGR